MIEVKGGAHRHSVVLQISHPSMHPDVISDRLEWDPKVSWLAGDPRKARDGTVLEGVYRSSYWCISEKLVGEGDFFRHFVEIIRVLEIDGDFIREIVRSGGRVTLTMQLPGDCDALSRLGPEALRRTAALGIELGVESFPHMRA